MKHSSVFLFLIIFLLACATQKSEPVPPVEYFSHTVKYQGETLGIIAGWYTGKSLNWKVIENDNPGLDVTRMKIGDTILIPKNILRRSDAFPQSYIVKINEVKVKQVETPAIVENEVDPDEELEDVSNSSVSLEKTIPLEIKPVPSAVTDLNPQVGNPEEAPAKIVGPVQTPDEIAAKSLEAIDSKIKEATVPAP